MAKKVKLSLFEKIFAGLLAGIVPKIIRSVMDVAGDILIQKFPSELDQAHKAVVTLRGLWDKLKYIIPLPTSVETMISEVLKIMDEEMGKDLTRAKNLGLVPK